MNFITLMLVLSKSKLFNNIVKTHYYSSYFNGPNYQAYTMNTNCSIVR